MSTNVTSELREAVLVCEERFENQTKKNFAAFIHWYKESYLRHFETARKLADEFYRLYAEGLLEEMRIDNTEIPLGIDMLDELLAYIIAYQNDSRTFQSLAAFMVEKFHPWTTTYLPVGM